MVKKLLLFLLICSILPGYNLTSFAGEEESDKTRIAVLPLVAREGVESQDVAALSDYFRGALVSTGAFVVLERERTKELLKEHALSQYGVTTTEYAVEAGKILNVQKMVTGTIGKVGSIYTINISMVNVGSGQIEKNYSRNYTESNIEGLMPILDSIALEMAKIKGLPAYPKYILGLTSIVGFGMSTYSYIQAEDSYDKYKEATTMNDLRKYKDDTKKYDDTTLYTGIAACGTSLLYYFYNRMYKKSHSPKNVTASLYFHGKNTVGVAIRTSF